MRELHILHEYRVDLVREQFTTVYIIARDEEDASAKALLEPQDELDWDNSDAEVERVVEEG